MLVGANLAVLVFGVLGVLVGAREYASGRIRTTLAAVPHRLPALWAKLIALSAIVVPVAVLGVVITFI